MGKRKEGTLRKDNKVDWEWSSWNIAKVTKITRSSKDRRLKRNSSLKIIRKKERLWRKVKNNFWNRKRKEVIRIRKVKNQRVIVEEKTRRIKIISNGL